MKNYLKTILFFFVASVALISCSDDDVTPPTAGFTLSDTEPTQWDEVMIISNPIAADAIEYTVSGGDFELTTSSIIFEEKGTYTVTQIVTNEGGSDTTSLTVEVDPYNTFDLDGKVVEFTEPPFWVAANPAHGIMNDYIRFENPIAGGTTVDLFKITPIVGIASPLEGSYTYNVSADEGTYKIVHTHNQEGFKYDWTTNGESGSDLVITLIEDKGGADNIYDITITNFNLNYGNWDFATFTWVTEGNKILIFHYRGAISISK
jgi:PKD repeat protein